MVWWHILIIAACSYLFGNISFARIISMSQKKDITKLGSGNPGSTNILRNFGLKFGLFNLFLDILKGLIPCLIVWLVTKNLVYLYIAGLSAMLGHIFPVFFGFRGGKGIATMLGVFLVADPIVTSIVIVCAAICWLLFKYGSVSSFLCVTTLTVYEGFYVKSFENPDRMVLSLLLFAIFCITWFMHRSNIKRLILGKESKVDLLKSVKKKIKNNTVGK